jgi:DNA-binding CsgD family transcriptional regulator
MPADLLSLGCEPLTKREVDVISLLERGLSNRAMADALDISLDAVKYHLRNVYGKLGVSRRIHAILMARSLGILRGAAASAPRELLEAPLPRSAHAGPTRVPDFGPEIVERRGDGISLPSYLEHSGIP